MTVFQTTAVGYYNSHVTPFAPQTSAAGNGAEDSAGSEARPVWTLRGLVSLFSCNRNGVDSGKMDMQCMDLGKECTIPK